MNGVLKKLATATAPIALLAGCSTIPSAPAVLLKADEGTSSVKIVDFPAERRGGWIVPQKDGVVRICSEPPTDVGINVTQLISLAAELKKGDVGANGSLDNSLISSIVELKGRTPAVLALRDVMYRMCEARATGNSLNPDELKVFDRIVTVIADFAKADLANAQEKQERASRQSTGDLSLAKQKETEGFHALEKKDWAAAQKYFEESEAAFNSYGWSYEYARALKSGGTDKERAQRVLNIKGRLPLSTKDALDSIAK